MKRVYRHGEPHRYTALPHQARYCRCAECKEGHRVYVAERRRKALATGTLSHGLPGTYDAGCRCEKCWYAKQVRYYTAGVGALTKSPKPSAYPGSQQSSRLTA